LKLSVQCCVYFIFVFLGERQSEKEKKKMEKKEEMKLEGVYPKFDLII